MLIHHTLSLFPISFFSFPTILYFISLPVTFVGVPNWVLNSLASTKDFERIRQKRMWACFINIYTQHTHIIWYGATIGICELFALFMFDGEENNKPQTLWCWCISLFGKLATSLYLFLALVSSELWTRNMKKNLFELLVCINMTIAFMLCVRAYTSVRLRSKYSFIMYCVVIEWNWV